MTGMRTDSRDWGAAFPSGKDQRVSDTRSSAETGTGATSTASKLKTAAPVAAGALAVVAGIVGFTMMGGESSEETAAIEPASVAAPEQPVATAAPEPGSSIPGVAFDQAQAPGARPAMGVEIVVKFKDDAKVKDIIDAFWKDQASAQAKFDAFKRGKPAFAGLKLGRVTYSNELVLIDETGQINDARSTAMRAIAARLKDNPEISYADPNMTAQPGAQ
jgi:hypothetical protein